MSAYSFSVSWLEIVKAKGEDRTRREVRGRQLDYPTRQEAEAARDWYADHPESWVPSFGVEPEVSDVRARFVSNEAAQPRPAA